MPTLASSEMLVPKNWEEFEGICADLFSRIWNDHNTVRYALLGERQGTRLLRFALGYGRHDWRAGAAARPARRRLSGSLGDAAAHCSGADHADVCIRMDFNASDCIGT
jgi:hypothetical protein